MSEISKMCELFFFFLNQEPFTNTMVTKRLLQVHADQDAEV